MKKIIEKRTDIRATPDQVWEVLTRDDLTRQWYAVFSEGTYAETDWQPGSKVTFLDKSQCGIVGHIATAEKPSRLVIEYDGQIMNGAEDYTSDMALQMKDVQESYTLTEQDGLTRLSVTLDMPGEYYDMMNGQWDTAMEKICSLAEML